MRNLKATVSSNTALAGPGNSNIGDPKASRRDGAPKNINRNKPSTYGADMLSVMNRPRVKPVLSKSKVKHLRSVFLNGSPILVIRGKNDCNESIQNRAAQPSKPKAANPMVD